MNITTDQILDALRAAMQPVDNNGSGYTVQELMALTHWSPDRVRAGLGRMIRAGTVQVGRGIRPAIDGTSRWVPTYTLAEPPRD